MNNRGTDTRPPVIIIEESVVDKYNLPPLAGWLYIVIVRHINRKSGEAFPSVARLAKLANMSRASVIRYTKVLEEANLISVTREKADVGDNEVNHYRLLTTSGVVSDSNHLVSDSNEGGITQQVGVVSESDHNQIDINQKEVSASVPPAKPHSHAADLEGYHKRFDYYRAFEAGFPDNARVKVSDNRTNKDHARQVFLASYSLDEVTALVRSKIAQGKTDYRFHYLMADLAQARLERNKHAPIPQPKYHRASDELIAQLEKGGYQRVH
jgi:DNA-binding transcriptional regulator YhcF (GntR family)